LLAIAVSAAAAPASALSGKGVEVPFDVDVYDQPGGEGTKRGEFLKGCSWVTLAKDPVDNWCNVESWQDPVPGGASWIWCGRGDDEKDYSVRMLTIEEVNAPTPVKSCGEAGAGAGGGQ
jgi:hypothetical protein